MVKKDCIDCYKKRWVDMVSTLIKTQNSYKSSFIDWYLKINDEIIIYIHFNRLRLTNFT